jgi:hypothetical protein
MSTSGPRATLNSVKANAAIVRNGMNAKKLKADMNRLISGAMQLGGARKKLTRKRRNSGRKTRRRH